MTKEEFMTFTLDDRAEKVRLFYLAIEQISKFAAQGNFYKIPLEALELITLAEIIHEREMTARYLETVR